MKLMTGLSGNMIFSASAKMPSFDIYVGDLVLPVTISSDYV